MYACAWGRVLYATADGRCRTSTPPQPPTLPPTHNLLALFQDAEPELEVNDEEAFGLDLSNFPITLTVSKVCRGPALCVAH